jgi:predicted membrane channel-forming protein YqfA (hemolysin III family)
VYEHLEGAIREKQEIKRGLEFGMLVFLVAGIPTVLTMYLLINLPSGLLATWTLVQLVLYLIGGVVAAKLIKPQ